MSVHKMISDEKLIEYLDTEVTTRLLAHRIYDINNYGWLSEDTEDPEFIGHAIWQTRPPLETEWDFLYGNGPVRHRPTEKQKLLIVAGHDFEGLMKAARLSIGLTLLHQSIAEKYPLGDNHYFWLHNADAILHLNMASDRIREYFVVAFFDETSETYKSKGRKNGWYVTPFKQVIDLCNKKPVEKHIVDATVGLFDIANQIFKYRETRNLIVHEIATKLGETNRYLIEKQQQAYDNGNLSKTEKGQPNYEELHEHHLALESKHKEELAKAITDLKDWYNLLVKLSSCVFEAEYWLRRNKLPNQEEAPA